MVIHHRGPPPPYKVDFPTLGSVQRATHLVPAPPARMTSLLTKRDVILKEVTLQSPHGEPSCRSDDFMQGHQAAGAIGAASLELEWPSDTNISSMLNSSALRLKYFAERHSFQSRLDHVTPVKYHTPHSISQRIM